MLCGSKLIEPATFRDIVYKFVYRLTGVENQSVY